MTRDPLDLLHCGDASRIGAYLVETNDGLALFDCGPTSCLPALRDALDSGPAPDAIVHNAGVIERALVQQMSDRLWDDQLEINLTAPLRITRAFLPGMIEAGKGRIVFVSSISAVLGTKYQSAYHAAKAGLLGAMKCLAEELSDTGVSTMAILPGAVKTEMLEGSGFPARMTPEEVARTLAFYALDPSTAHNGCRIEMFGI